MLAKVALGLAQTEVVVWPASDLFSIVLILPVVLPKANRADLIGTTSEQSFVFAARTAVCLMLFVRLGYIFKSFVVHNAASISSMTIASLPISF
jgi:hypothetical protein